MATATLGGGCFWCLEAVFQRAKGVSQVISGYAGGHMENPDYRSVCSGRTGHAEVVRVEFDPEQISFKALLEVFFTIHDPTTPNRQGADIGPQYRSIILWEDKEQRDMAQTVIQQLEADRVFSAPIVTEVEPLTRFYPAEDDHQDYYRQNAPMPYCQAVIVPKLTKAQAAFPERLRD